MKLWEKVNNVTGNGTKARFLVEYINAGAKFILASLPEKFLWTIASETEVYGWKSTDTDVGAENMSLGEGSSIAYDKILAVYRYDGATTTSVTVGTPSVTTDYYRGKKRVAAEAPDKNIHIFDEDSSLLTATEMFPKFYKISGKIYIKPDPDYNATGDTQTYTPLGGSSTTVASKAGDKGVIVYSAPPIIDENTDTWILTEYENIAIFYAGSLDFFRLSSVYRDLCKTQVDEVVGSILTSYRDAIPQFTPLPSEPSGTLTFTVNTDLPSGMTITKALPTFSFTDSLPLDIGIASSLPTGLSLTLSLPTMDGIVSALPSGLNISSSLPSDFNIVEPNPSSFVSPSSVDAFNSITHTSSYIKVDDALLKAEQLVDGSVTTNNAQEWLDDEDSEMAASVAGIAGVEIQRAQSEIQKERNKLEQFSASVSHNVNKYQNDIAKFSAEVTKEQQRVRSGLEKYAQNVAKEDSRIKSQLSKYTQEVQKESQRIQSDLAKYQRDVEKSVQKYQADTAKYQQEIAKEGARAGIDVTNYNAELTKEKTRVEMSLAKWQASLGKTVQAFTLDLQVYQAEVQKEGQRISSDVAKYQAEVQKASKDMEKLSQQFTLDMQKYTALINGYSAKFQSDMAEAGAFIQEAGLKLQAAQIYTAKSAASLQTSSQYYQMATAELSGITGAITAPQQQQISQRQEQGAAT